MVFKYLMLVLGLLVFCHVAHAFVNLQQNAPDTQTIGTLNRTLMVVRFYNDELVGPTKITFFVESGAQDAVINGFVQNYSDDMTWLNNTWREQKINYTYFDPGTYILEWGVRLENGTEYGHNTTMTITGESMPLAGNGTNMTAFFMKKEARYGAGSTVVADRLRARQQQQRAPVPLPPVQVPQAQVPSAPVRAVEPVVTKVTTVTSPTPTPVQASPQVPVKQEVVPVSLVSSSQRQSRLWMLGILGGCVAVLFVLAFFHRKANSP